MRCFHRTFATSVAYDQGTLMSSDTWSFPYLGLVNVLPVLSPNLLFFRTMYFYGDLVYKLRRVKGEAIFISSGSKIVKRLRSRQYDPAIIERTKGLVLGPFTASYISFLKRCTLTNKAVGTIWRALSKPPQRRQGPDPRPLWLLVGTPSAFEPELAYRLRVAQPTLMDVTRYFWYTFILLYIFVYYIFMTSPLWLAVGPQTT